jgi:hypothetical protein
MRYVALHAPWLNLYRFAEVNHRLLQLARQGTCCAARHEGRQVRGVARKDAIQQLLCLLHLTPIDLQQKCGSRICDLESAAADE